MSKTNKPFTTYAWYFLSESKTVKDLLIDLSNEKCHDQQWRHAHNEEVMEVIGSLSSEICFPCCLREGRDLHLLFRYLPFDVSDIYTVPFDVSDIYLLM